MGADLTIDNPLPKYEDEKYRYFRDSYNVTNILWKFNLSYWKLYDDFNADQLIEDGVLSIEGVLKLRQMIDQRYYTFRDFLDNMDVVWLKENHASIDDKNTVQSWKDFFLEKSIRLVQFIDRAIESESGIHWSV